jgi:hypothetical protein
MDVHLAAESLDVKSFFRAHTHSASITRQDGIGSRAGGGDMMREAWARGRPPGLH